MRTARAWTGAVGGTVARGVTARARVGARRTVAVAAGAGAAAALLAGCEVPTSGVVDVGVPASGLPAAPGQHPPVALYFLAGGRLTPVRVRLKDGPDRTSATVARLFDGPAGVGRPDLTSRLPRLSALAAVRIRGGTVTVTLPAGPSARVPAPDALGLRQLACTLEAALGPAVPQTPVPPTGGDALPTGDGSTAATAVPPGLAAPAVRVVLRGPGWQRSAHAVNCAE